MPAASELPEDRSVPRSVVFASALDLSAVASRRQPLEHKAEPPQRDENDTENGRATRLPVI